jgi:hypothetical protein
LVELHSEDNRDFASRAPISLTGVKAVEQVGPAEAKADAVVCWAEMTVLQHMMECQIVM